MKSVFIPAPRRGNPLAKKLAALLAAMLSLSALFGQSAAPEMTRESPEMAAPSVRLICGGKSREARILFDPQKGAGLFFYGDWAWRVLWLDQKALQSMEDSAQKYISLFNARKLKRNASKQSLAAFKSAQALEQWGCARDRLDREGPAKIRFGYNFIENSPYFSISVPSVQNQAAPQPGDSVLQNSGKTAVFLTQKKLSFFLDTAKKAR